VLLQASIMTTQHQQLHHVLQEQQQQEQQEQQQLAKEEQLPDKQEGSTQQQQQQQPEKAQEQQEQQPEQQEQLLKPADKASSSSDTRAAAFAAGQTLTLSCSDNGSATNEQLLLQVEKFLARGGNADVYQVKLLQRLLPPASPSSSAQLPAGNAAGKQQADPLQPGQYFAIKVARTLETYPEEETKKPGVTPAAYFRAARRLLQAEFDVLQEMSKCVSIIKAYMFGSVTAAAAAAEEGEAAEADTAAIAEAEETAAAALVAGAPESSTEQQLEDAAAPPALPCMLMEYADGGSVKDLVYKQHGQPTRLSARQAWQVTAVAVDGLRHLHAAGYTHHDVKLNNMLCITSRGRVRCERVAAVAAPGLQHNMRRHVLHQLLE
jgi:serine/threonine protein kinase